MTFVMIIVFIVHNDINDFTDHALEEVVCVFISCPGLEVVTIFLVEVQYHVVCFFLFVLEP